MRDAHLKSIDEKIRRIRFYKLIGKMLLWTAVIVLLISIFGNLNQIMMMSTDTLNKQNDLSMEVDELRQSIDGMQENGSTVTKSTLNDTDRALIERIVMSESGDQPLEAQMAVAQTISDRMTDFGDTLIEATETYSTHDNGEPTDSVKLAVANVFDNGERVYDGGTYQFHDDSVLPYWTANKVKRGSIGRLNFYGGYAN